MSSETQRALSRTISTGGRFVKDVMLPQRKEENLETELVLSMTTEQILSNSRYMTTCLPLWTCDNNGDNVIITIRITVFKTATKCLTVWIKTHTKATVSGRVQAKILYKNGCSALI